MTVELRLVPTAESSPSQLAAWRRLWTLLLAKGDGATSGELAPHEDTRNGQPNGTTG
jgi:hypothetical protein